MKYCCFSLSITILVHYPPDNQTQLFITPLIPLRLSLTLPNTPALKLRPFLAKIPSAPLHRRFDIQLNTLTKLKTVLDPCLSILNTLRLLAFKEGLHLCATQSTGVIPSAIVLLLDWIFTPKLPLQHEIRLMTDILLLSRLAPAVWASHE